MEIREKDAALDLSGAVTQFPVTRKFLASLIFSVGIYFLLALIDPLAAYGELASKALGFFVGTIVFMVTSGVDLGVIAILAACLGVTIGLFDWGTVSSRLGSSQFYNMLGMIMVACGCEFTPLGRRLSYHILRKFGQKPVVMAVFIGVLAAVLSAFVSNTAIIILFSAIMNGMLLAMGEEPGKSKLGKVIMLLIPLCSSVGGMALFSGSPTGNAAALSYMTSAVGDQSYAPSYAQWAYISVPTFVITIIPAILIYLFWFRVKDSECKRLPQEYYENLIKELGPIGGSEIRWIIIVVAMVALMMAGVTGPYVAMFCAAVSVFPIVGVAPAKEVIKRAPWSALLAICLLPLLGNVVTDTGLSDWISAMITPLLGDISPLALCMLSALMMAVLINLLVNAMMGVQALVMSIMAPLCVALGYNPTIILLLAAFAASFYWCMGVNQYVQINKEYGWWEMKDPIVPGLLAAILIAVVSAVIAYTLGPVFGMSLYL